MPANAVVRPGFPLRATIVLPIVTGFLISLASPAHGFPLNQTGRWTPAHALDGATAPDTGTLSRSWMLLLDRSSAEASPIRAGRHRSPEGAALPAAFTLLPSWPNPFAERATIRFALPVASRVRLEVFDLVGRRLRTLTDRRYEAGEHEVVWDRRTARGALAAPGLYFYRVEAGEFRARRAMMIVP